MTYLKKIFGNSVYQYLKRKKNLIQQRNQSKLPVIDKEQFKRILTDDLGLIEGDTVFIHSSLDKINLSISPFDVLYLIQEIIGTKGTVIFPTYPLGYSYDFLQQNKVFYQKLTPSSTGILNEIARRQKNAFRSLHPTKSVVAIGQNAEEITNTHHLSPYPYDSVSPYYKIYKFNAKIIGIGVSSKFLSCVHTVDDTYKNNFIVDVYHKTLFEATCINNNNEKIIVKTYAHDMNTMIFNLSNYFKKYISQSILKEINIKGYKYFKADAFALYQEMIRLYEKDNVTIYPKKLYKNK